MPAGRPRRYFKTLASLSRVNLLHQLQTRGSMTVAALAAALDLHPNTAREHLHRLVETGLVRADPILRASKGRPEMLYRATTRPSSPATASRQVAALVDHMGECGFDVQIAPGATCMTMRDCPFDRMANDNPQVCLVHRALIEDALRASGGPLRAGELQRHSGGRECKLDLHHNM